jgi:preprotein translocase subunit YajC
MTFKHEIAFLQQVGPKAGTAGAAPETAQTTSSGAQQQAPAPSSTLYSLLPLLIMVPFLFLMFRRQKKEATERSKLKKGDKIVSQSGLIGELVEMDERVAKVKLAPGTTVQMLVSSISPFASADPAAKKADDLKDLKDAKAAADKK